LHFFNHQYIFISAIQNSNFAEVGGHTWQSDILATTTYIDKDTIFEPSSLVVKFSELKIQLKALLKLSDPKAIANHCGSLRASTQANIPLFSTEFIKRLDETKSVTVVVQKIALFTNWSDHSILSSIVQVSNVPEAAALFTQFIDGIDSSQPLTKYPIPAPSHHMIPNTTSTHTVLAVQLNLQLNHSTFQNVLDTRLLIQEKCEVTPHCLQLLAVAKTSYTIIYWTIPKHVVSLITSKVQQNQSDLHQSGIQQVAIYPGTALVTGSVLTVGPFVFFTKASIKVLGHMTTLNCGLYDLIMHVT